MSPRSGVPLRGQESEQGTLNTKLLKLDLGCGAQKKSPEYTGVDISDKCGADIVHDLAKKPWPFTDNSVEEIWSSHFFEHLDGKQRIIFMEEAHRVLKTGSKITIVTPYWSSIRAIADPTHAWPPICEQSYLYFSKKWRQENHVEHYDINCDFDLSECSYILDGEIATGPQESKQFAMKHYTNSVLDLQMILVKK